VIFADGRLKSELFVKLLTSTNKDRHEHVILFVNRRSLEGAEHFVQEAECTLGPDDETAEVTTGGKLEQVQAANVCNLNTRQVPERTDDSLVLIVNDKGTTALAMTAVAHLPLAGAQFARVGDLDNIRVCAETFEKRDGLLGLSITLNGGRDNEGNLVDTLNAVAAGKDERRKGRGSERRDHSKAALVLVDLDVPPAPNLGWGKHATTTAHVTKGGLYTSCNNLNNWNAIK
jgi:hypothetical protein